MVVGVYGSPTHCEGAPLVYQPPTLPWQVRSCVGLLDSISGILMRIQNSPRNPGFAGIRDSSAAAGLLRVPNAGLPGQRPGLSGGFR